MGHHSVDLLHVMAEPDEWRKDGKMERRHDDGDDRLDCRNGIFVETTHVRRYPASPRIIFIYLFIYFIFYFAPGGWETDCLGGEEQLQVVVKSSPSLDFVSWLVLEVVKVIVIGFREHRSAYGWACCSGRLTPGYQRTFPY